MSAILCFGEVLFDGLPNGPTVGGAPLNVALHLHQWGVKTHIASAIGKDEWGKKLMRFLNQREFSHRGITESDHWPTGWVDVSLDAQGSPSYTICEPAAWDAIPYVDGLAKSSSMLVFGSLAMRHAISRKSLVKYTAAISHRVMDINLRPPFVDWPLIEGFMNNVEVLKLNREELHNWLGYRGIRVDVSENKDLHVFAQHFDRARQIIVTDGANGAFLIAEGVLRYQPIPRMDVADTVGCGDALLAGFLFGQTQGWDLDQSLEWAVRAGSAVAMHEGGTPKVSIETIQNI